MLGRSGTGPPPPAPRREQWVRAEWGREVADPAQTSTSCTSKSPPAGPPGRPAPGTPTPPGAEVQVRDVCGVQSWALNCAAFYQGDGSIPAPPPLATSTKCRAGWKGREAAACRSLPRSGKRAGSRYGDPKGLGALLRLRFPPRAPPPPHPPASG